MKIAFNQKLQKGPWGGGNRFLDALLTALKRRGDQIVFDLMEDNIDVIVVLDPRHRNPAVTFTPGAVLRYLLRRNPEAVVVHRINECDERKGTHTMNWRLRLANYCADATVFIGTWLCTLDVWRRESEDRIILNGADPIVFNDRGHRPWDGIGPLRLVTHHWGGHRLKGFDVFERLDAMIGSTDWRDRLELTYIGNLPTASTLPNTRIVGPLDGVELAEAIRANHAYVTASVNEPAGMHHIEGALCGLPLLFRQSGALPEYCAGFGEPFNGPGDVEAALISLMARYDGYRANLAAYPHTAESMCAGYIGLFDELVRRRSELRECRRLFRDPLALALNQVPW